MRNSILYMTDTEYRIWIAEKWKKDNVNENIDFRETNDMIKKKETEYEQRHTNNSATDQLTC